MPEPKFPQLPFVTREMLKFGNEAKLQISVDVYDKSGNNLVLTGLTRENPFTYTLETVATTTLQNFTFGISDIPIFATLRGESVSSQIGDVTAAMHLVVNGVRVLLLAEGMPSHMHGISWPSEHPVHPINERGVMTKLTGINPSAGDETTATSSVHSWIRLMQVTALLSTDANAANREVYLDITTPDGGRVILTAPEVHVASTVKEYHWTQGSDFLAVTTANVMVAPLPTDLWLPPASTITTQTGSIQVGDDWGSLSIRGEFYYQAN